MPAAVIAIPRRVSELSLPDTNNTSLLYWLLAYGEHEVAGSPAGTVGAKRRDLQRFYTWFQQTLRSDEVDLWTKRLTKDYRTWLSETGNADQPFAAATVNRNLATLRHCARWIHKRRPFVAGFPFDGVTDLAASEPEAKGLTSVQKARVRAAADKLLRLQTKTGQLPHRNYAVQSVLFKTALRVSELCNLDYGQYQAPYFLRVQRKGANVTGKVYVPSEAREDLARYIDQERGTLPGPLFLTATGGRLRRQQVFRYLKQLEALANMNLVKKERIHLHPHVLRHTRLKELAAKSRDLAQKASGNRGEQHIARYLNPLDEDYERAAEEV